MKISTKYSNLDASMSRTGGRNETMDFGQLKRGDRRTVKIEENSGLRLGVLHNARSMNNLRGSCGIRRAGNREDSLCEFKRIQGLAQCLIEIRNGNLGLTINSRNKVCGRGEGIKRSFWR